MSTKIYDGVRFPRARLADFVATMRERHLRVVFRVASAAMSLPDTAKAAELDCDGNPSPAPPDSVDRHRRATYVTERAQRQNSRSTRDPFYDLACGWLIWLPPRSRWALAVPWGERLVRAPLPRWVESYGYWDNTDEPPRFRRGAGRRAWRQRRDDWSFAFAEATEGHKLQLHGYDPSAAMDTAGLYLRLVRYWRRPG